jgi:hypothetical protein
MSIERRLQALEAAGTMGPDFCSCSQIEIHENTRNLPMEKLPSNRCNRCGLFKFVVWISCASRTDIDQRNG